MGVEVFGVLDQRGGVYDIYEGFAGEVAGPFSLGGCEGAFGLVVLGELGLDVVVDALYLLRHGLAGV